MQVGLPLGICHMRGSFRVIHDHRRQAVTLEKQLNTYNGCPRLGRELGRERVVKLSTYGCWMACGVHFVRCDATQRESSAAALRYQGNSPGCMCIIAMATAAVHVHVVLLVLGTSAPALLEERLGVGWHPVVTGWHGQERWLIGQPGEVLCSSLTAVLEHCLIVMPCTRKVRRHVDGNVHVVIQMSVPSYRAGGRYGALLDILWIGTC